MCFVVKFNTICVWISASSAVFGAQGIVSVWKIIINVHNAMQKLIIWSETTVGVNILIILYQMQFFTKTFLKTLTKQKINANLRRHNLEILDRHSKVISGTSKHAISLTSVTCFLTHIPAGCKISSASQHVSVQKRQLKCCERAVENRYRSRRHLKTLFGTAAYVLDN